MEKQYTWPEKCEMENIENYVDWNDNSKDEIKFTRKKNNTINTNPYFINTSHNYNNYPNGTKYCVCLIKNIHNMYSYRKSRKINIKECLLLQGFDTNFIRVIPSRNLKEQLGNSMSVNVVKKVLENLIL